MRPAIRAIGRRYSGESYDLASELGNLDETIARSMARAEDPCVAVIPEGPYLVPYCDAGQASDRPPNEYSAPSGFGGRTRLELG